MRLLANSHILSPKLAFSWPDRHLVPSFHLPKSTTILVINRKSLGDHLIAASIIDQTCVNDSSMDQDQVVANWEITAYIGQTVS